MILYVVNAGTYGLYLQRTNNPGNAVPIAFGETKTGSIITYAQMNNYTFTATAGNMITTRMHSSWAVGPQIDLYAPNGALITSSANLLSSYDTEITKSLTSTGRYTILVGDTSGSYAGTYSLSLQNQETNSPVASFTGTPTSGSAPLTVAFTDASTNSPTSWYWTFGDGSTSTTKSPSHTYTTAGTYTVTLKATNTGGSNTLTRTGYISVTTPAVAPVASFTGTPTSGSAPLTVAFTDASTNSPTSWYWTFGDGSTSTTKSPSHTYTTAGTYTVTLKATNTGGSNTLTRTGYISVTTAAPAPVASFTGTPTSGSAPLTVAFTDASTNSPTSWYWTFGDGSTSTTEPVPHLYYGRNLYRDAEGHEYRVQYSAATQAPHPMQVAASKARSEFFFGISRA